MEPNEEQQAFLEALPPEGRDLFTRTNGFMRYYDRDGKPITALDWCWKFADDSYRVVKLTVVRGHKRVSTIWIGTGSYPGVIPKIFETMVFGRHADGSLGMRRYETIEAARAGHAEMVRWWSLNHQQRRKYVIRVRAIMKKRRS